uniref:Ankyrin repeat protein n=1 Tax=viral metagenome TaxID=1070528 RepID=A0A6C0CBV4_9ZZZZ
MNNTFEQDNTIHFIFEKNFDQRTSDGQDLFDIPFKQILEKTINDPNIHALINKMTYRPLSAITDYLSNIAFLNKFLFKKLKKKIYVQILLNNQDEFAKLIASGREMDKTALRLMIINGRYWHEYFLQDLCSNDMLMYAAEFAKDDIYFYLKNQRNLVPNDQIFYRAVVGGSMPIIKDISETISISDKILETAFQTNNSEVIIHLVNDALTNELRVSQNLISYPIINGNIDLLHELDKLMTFNYHTELYFSALLSGSMKMVMYIEGKFHNIHENYVLDTTKSKREKGFSSILSDEMVYTKNGNNYFSHTLNYAIQSKSLTVIRYIISLGYGVSSSNVITAIKTGDVEIVWLIVEYYGKKLEKYFVYYFSMNSYIHNKFAVAKFLLDNDHIDLSVKKMNITGYRRETTHLNLITQSTQLMTDDNYDSDYLLKYKLFFPPFKGFNLNHLLLVKMRLYLELGRDQEIQNMMNQKWNVMESQHIIDSIYMFGDLNKIKKFSAFVPSAKIIMETLCYNQIGKFCFLLQKGTIDRYLENIYPMITLLQNPILNGVMNKKNIVMPCDLKFWVLSGNYQNIPTCAVDKDNIRELIATEDIEFIKKFDLTELVNEDVINWAIEADLLEIVPYLKSLII